MRTALFNISDEKAETITDILTSCGFEIITPELANGGEKIGYLLNVPGYTKTRTPTESCAETHELLIFADITENALNTALTRLRGNNIKVRFKAVLTKFNRDLTYNELMEHLLEEENNFRK